MSLRLEISTTPLQWDMQLRPAQLNLSVTLPKVEINSTAAKIEISGSRSGELAIDTTAARAAMGFKNFTQFNQDFADEAMQKIADAIAKFASDGDRMMEFQRGNAIVDLAYESTTPAELSIEWAHKPGPDIDYTPGSLQTKAVRGQLNTQLRRGTVANETAFPSAQLLIKQYNRVDINVAGNRTDQQV